MLQEKILADATTVQLRYNGEVYTVFTYCSSQQTWLPGWMGSEEKVSWEKFFELLSTKNIVEWSRFPQ